MTPRERVVVHMAAHPRITLRELAAVAGVALTGVGKRSFMRLVHDLRSDRIFQTSTRGLDSEFTFDPDRDPDEAMIFGEGGERG
jgi:hypothetical protein